MKKKLREVKFLWLKMSSGSRVGVVSFSDFLCFWFYFTGYLTNCQVLIPTKVSFDCNGVETFEKVSGVELVPSERIPLYSSANGAITADCYNRCRASPSCSAFWIDYNTSECFRLPQPKFSDQKVDLDFNRPSAYFERLCLVGDICSKAWVSERVPGYELMGHDDVIIKSVVSRKRCVELCLTDKRLPCRSADYWENRKECRLSREDRRSQPGAFARTTPEVEYIENACIQPAAANKGKECEWEVTNGVEFRIFDFTAKALSLADCQRTCESYSAFTCRSVTFDMVTGICLLSGSDTTTTSTILLRMREKKIYAQRVPCVDMTLECQGEAMVAKLKSHAPFYGKLFSSPVTPGCEIFGHGKVITSITFPFSSCGVHQRESDGSFTATLIVQHHPLIQKRGDSAFRLVCFFPEGNRTLSQVFGFESESRRIGASSDTSSVSTGIMPPPTLGIGSSVVINSTAKSPAVSLRIMDSNGIDVTGVSLGDELFLKVEVEPNSAYGLTARDLIAKSGTNEEELVLLDSAGCPEDPAIFPLLRKEPGSKSLKTRFEAFKFTNDAVVRFQVHLQFCRHECPPVKCDGDVSHGRRRKRGVASVYEMNPGLLELRREIIVSSSSLSNRLSALSPRIKPPPMSSTLEDIQLPTKYSGPEICGSKHFTVGLIIACFVLLVIILFCGMSCLQGIKRKSPSQSLSCSPHLVLRPGNNATLNTLRSLRE